RGEDKDLHRTALCAILNAYETGVNRDLIAPMQTHLYITGPNTLTQNQKDAMSGGVISEVAPYEPCSIGASAVLLSGDLLPLIMQPPLSQLTDSDICAVLLVDEPSQVAVRKVPRLF
ncbi:hypothetical protein, partial [Candidatus Hakubella thermalkaliphila]|uniref:hypothetical protein n=1 Tax=Candidatus Hakubella thermalkaliphila TaxID=2754717 RepID=UPI001594A977